VKSNRILLQRAVGLSDVDRELIALLQLDGRRSYADLSRELGLTPRQVGKRLTQLLESEIIYITAVGDPALLGYRSLALLGIRAHGRALAEIAEELAKLDEVDYVNISAGRYDVFAHIACRTLAELHNTVEARVRPIPGILHVEIFPYFRVHYQATAVVRQKLPASGSPITTNPPIDSLDRRIVAELSSDGRVPLQRVGERLGMSETHVRRRLNRLQQLGVIRVMAITNPGSMGFETIARLGITVSPGHRILTFADALASEPTVTSLALSASRYDILCEVVCRDSDELSVVRDRVRALDGLERCEFFVYLAQPFYKPIPPARLRTP
jgi:Lrp/AsnC family transcriptional regulator for asnA, asnC and gidA